MRRELPSDPLLLLREDAAPSPPADAEARVASRLAASLAGSSSVAGAPVTPKSSGGTAKVLAERFVRWSVVPLGVGVALGAGGQALRGGGELLPQPATPVASVVAVVASAPVISVEVAPEPAASSAAVSSAPSAAAKNTLSAERNVLDRARKRLAADEPLEALTFLEQHSQQFPRGQLSEEREAMRVNVLVLLGRVAEAKARGEAFVARYPSSLMGSSVRAALRSGDAQK